MSHEDEARRLAREWRDEWNHRLPNLVIRDVDFIAAKLAPILAERDKLARQVEKLADWCGIDMVDLDERTGEEET